MSEQTGGVLEQEVRQVMELLDAMDMRGLASRLTDDAQGVDEISRQWTRGREALEGYFAQLESSVSNVHSQVSDLYATVWGGIGLATFVLEQTYELNGHPQSLSAPTSMLFRNEQGAWKVAMVQSVPFPDQQ